ncbi:MAG: cysteine-rich CWC family protein [Chlorobi bacterium]|nr:cysteine-rich CWC family protein [Chlorobiota bacterium]
MTHTHEENRSGGKSVVCPMCGQVFFCSLSEDCWCAKKIVPQEVRDFLAGRYETCVCSGCLDRLIADAAVSGVQR